MYSKGTNKQLRKKRETDEREIRRGRGRQRGRWRLPWEGSGSSFTLVAPDRARVKPRDPI